MCKVIDFKEALMRKKEKEEFSKRQVLNRSWVKKAVQAAAEAERIGWIRWTPPQI